MDGITPPKPKRSQPVKRYVKIGSDISDANNQKSVKNASLPDIDNNNSDNNTKNKKYRLKIIKNIYYKWVNFYKKHQLTVRLTAGAMALLMIVTIGAEISNWAQDNKQYSLSDTAQNLLGKSNPSYGQKLKYDAKTAQYIYNADYQPQNQDVAGQIAGPKFSASFASDPSKPVEIKDAVNNVTMSYTPKFNMSAPIQSENRLIYPLKNKDGAKVYTLRAGSVKEDIVLEKLSQKSIEFKYELKLAEGTEARLENDGSIGIYGVNQLLLGNVTAGTEKDQELLQKARQNSPKNQLLFTIPKPFILNFNGKLSESTAKYELKNNELTIRAENLNKARYPITIDPTVYIETAAKLMRGNNESNIDFDINNELIQKSQTTGARIDAWSSTTNLSNAVWGQGTAVAGGYIYSVGGVGSGTTTTSTYNTAGSSTYVVPAGVNYVTVKAWGAGGGGGAGTNGTGSGGSGGGGGYAKAVIAVTPGESLTVDVGTAGAKASANGRAGNGGGDSRVKRSSTVLVDAAGGGGGAGRRGNTGGTTGNGGAGGGTTGIAGTTGSTGGPGQGGTQAAGGAGGTAGAGGAAGVAGAANAGGNGSSTAACATAATGTGGNGGTGGGGAGGTFTTTCAPGGGGGGGYYGGGGGGSTSTNARTGGGGGGGSSYINPTGLVSGSDSNLAGSGTSPGNSGDSDRGGLGDGGTGATTAAGATAGDNGIITISYTAAGTISDAVYWAHFNTTTNAIESPNPGTGACTGWCNNSVYNLPTALTNLSLVSYNGFLYAIGGSNSSGTPQTTVYIAKLGANGEPQLWHPTGGTPVYWYSDTALSNARSQFAAVANNNRMYILGGLTTSSTVLSTNTVQYADIKPNGVLTTWTSTGMQALGTARYGLTAHIYNDVLYALGGNATFSGSPVTTVEYSKLKTDGTMNSWVATSSIATSGRLTVGGSFSTVFGGYMYITGGCTTVNASGYCTAIATDSQLASINSDGSLGPFNTIIGLSNDRFAHTFIAWQGGLYRLGGCRSQDIGTGACSNTALDVDYGVINPGGEASTVATSVASGTSPCSGSTPYGCDLPSASVGNMANISTIINGYLYIMGGCNVNACNTQSTGVTYQSISSTGTLQKPKSCSGTYTDSYCISNISLPVSLGGAGVTVFNNRIYIVGGFTGTNISANIYYTTVNYDGSIQAWQSTDLSTIGATDVSWTFAYSRANPGSAGSVPGNLYIFGGCASTSSGIGCASYTDSVVKCNISNTGVPSACSETNQTQIGTPTGGGSPGLGAHIGTVYANYIYLMGGLGDGITDLTEVRYAKFDDNNNVVESDGSGTAAWTVSPNEILVGRRRGAGFGYNGFLYVTGGYDGTDALADIEFSKINVSDGSIGTWDSSSVTINRRWALTVPVSNSYAYVIGGCTQNSGGTGPTNCGTRTNSIQTFQIYNNDSGTPIDFTAAANQFTTDRLGAGSAIYNGYIYVAGGCVSTTTDCDDVTDNVQFASIDAYGTIGTWANTTDATLPGQRGHGKFLEAGGALYWVGGQDDGGTAQTTVYYGVPDAATGNVASWNTASNVLPAARTKFGAAEWNDRIYITGGLDGAGADQTTVYYSPVLSRSVSSGDVPSAWNSSTGFDTARSGNTTVAYANNLYLFGGYDGANYLNDSQFTQINSDGTVDAWTFTTSLPTPLSQADGFVANGYVYIVGGRSSNTNCVSKTLVAPISANTTIATGNNPTGVGEWFETNVRYGGNRYANSVSYANGKMYVLGGVCNGFPTISDRLVQNFSTAATSHLVTMPATVNSGDLLMVLFTNDGNATAATPSGWTAPSTPNNTQVRGTNARGSVFIKVAGGTEDGTTVDFVTSVAEEASAQVYRIEAGNWAGTTADVEVANGGDPGATTTTPNPPSLNPGAWGTENTLWIAYAAGSSYTAVTTYPTNYNGGAHNLSNTGTGGASVSSAWYNSAAASEDPGTFTMSTNSDGIAFTIAVRPPAFGLTGSNKVVQSAVYSQPQIANYSRMIDTDTDVFPTKWLMNGLDNSIGARWQMKYRSMHDINPTLGGSDSVLTTPPSTYTLQQNPNEDCGTSATMPVMTTWGQETNVGDVTLGTPGTYTPKESGGSNINCARYFYFYVSIDASRTFGYPEDVNRGPTIADLSLFFTADPSKRMRHGKTFTGGELQPLDTPF